MGIKISHAFTMHKEIINVSNVTFKAHVMCDALGDI